MSRGSIVDKRKPRARRKGLTLADQLGPGRPVVNTTPEEQSAVLTLLRRRGALDLAGMLGVTVTAS